MRPCPVHIIGERIAIAIIGATNARRRMGPDRRGPLRGVYQIWIGRTKARIADHVVGIIIGIGAVIGGVE
jgi:hypothetical protein